MSAITLHIQIKTHIYIYIIESLVHVTYVIVRHYNYRHYNYISFLLLYSLSKRDFRRGKGKVACLRLLDLRKCECVSVLVSACKLSPSSSNFSLPSLSYNELSKYYFLRHNIGLYFSYTQT